MEVILGFIDQNKSKLGVEPICRELQAAPSAYDAVKTRPLSARAVPDAVMGTALVTLWKANDSACGARKLWKAARRAGHDVGRDQAARSIRQAGIRGMKRGRRVLTTRRDTQAERSPDLVKRNFTATAPKQLWVTDLTYVPTRAGVACACFIVDAFSQMTVGWRVASTMRTDMVRDALEMARWRQGTALEWLSWHLDAGSHFTSVGYGERPDELGTVPSIRTVSDSFDNALAEATNRLSKSEVISRPGQRPWKATDDVELATPGWVHWWNTTQLHGYLNDVPPEELEAAYANQHTDQELAGIQ